MECPICPNPSESAQKRRSSRRSRMSALCSYQPSVADVRQVRFGVHSPQLSRFVRLVRILTFRHLGYQGNHSDWFGDLPLFSWVVLRTNLSWGQSVLNEGKTDTLSYPYVGILFSKRTCWTVGHVGHVRFVGCPFCPLNHLMCGYIHLTSKRTRRTKRHRNDQNGHFEESDTLDKSDSPYVEVVKNVRFARWKKWDKNGHVG